MNMLLYIRKLAALLTVILVSSYANATSYTWNGGTSSDWATATNWTPNGIPGSTDDVTINGAGIQPILDVSRSVTNLTISGTNTTLGLNTYTLTITGTATFTAGTINNGAISCTGTSVTFGSANFGATVTASCATVFLNGSTFNNKVTITKTGGSNNASTGGNNFKDTTIITNSSSTGYLMLGSSQPDTFQVVTLSNTNVSYLSVGHGSGSTVINGTATFSQTGTGGNSALYSNYNGTVVYNGNIEVNCTAGYGVIFGEGSGSSTLSSGKTISVGSSGFSAGNLRLKNFTQQGSTPQSITLTGTALLNFNIGSIFNGNVTVVSPQLSLNGCTFNGTADLTKNGATNNLSNGNNVFNGATTITNSGTGYLLLGYVSNMPDTFNGPLTLQNLGTASLHVGYNALNNAFNGTTTLYTTGSTITIDELGTSTFNGDILFGGSSTATISIERGTLGSGYSLGVSGTGYSNGTIQLYQFTQNGATAQTLNLSNSAKLILTNGCVFNGPVSFSAPSIFVNGATFNGTASISKTGTTNDQWSIGSNTFNSTTDISNSGSGYLLLGAHASYTDTYNGDVTFIRSGAGQLYVGYNNVSYLNKNVTVNVSNSTNFSFSGNSGTTHFMGTTAQSVSNVGSGTGVPEFRRLVMNNSSSGVTFNTNTVITVQLTLTNGKIAMGTYNSAPAVLTMNSGSTVSGGSDNSFVSGKIKKVGSQAFTFPLGFGNYYHPVSISAPVASSDAFEAEYINSPQPHGIVMDYTIEQIISCEYWKLERKAGTSNVIVTAGVNANPCGILNVPQMRIVAWNGTQWKDLGSSSYSVNGNVASVTASANVPFTQNPVSISVGYANSGAAYAILSRNNDGGYYTPLNDQLYFSVEGEYTSGTLSYKVYDRSRQVVLSSSLASSINTTLRDVGNNRYILNVQSLATGYYELVVINEKNEAFLLKFKK